MWLLPASSSPSSPGAIPWAACIWADGQVDEEPRETWGLEMSQACQQGAGQ